MRRTITATACAAALTATVAWGQPPGGEGPQKRKTPGVEKKADFPGTPGFQPGTGGPPGTGPVQGFPGPGGPGGPPLKADPQVEAWVKTLTDKMNDPHDAIRESARAALVAVGPPALPALRRLADGNDAKAYTATRLVQQIERAAAMSGMGGGGGFGVSGGLGDPRFGPRPQPNPGGPSAGRQPGEDPRPGAGREGGENPLGRVLGELKLTDEQAAKAEKAIGAYVSRSRELLEAVRSGKIERADVPDAMMKLGMETMAELRRSLTPEQLRRFDELVPSGRSIFPFPGQPGGADRPGRRDDPPGPDQPRRPRSEPDRGP